MSQASRDRVPPGEVWEELCEALSRAGRLVQEAGGPDDFELAEGYRYLARVTRHALHTFIDRPDPARPRFDRASPKIGGDNPDYLYASCAVDGRWDYRIRVRRNDAFSVGIGSYYGGLGSRQGLQCSGYLTLNDVESEADGSFQVIASAERKPGNWLPMKPATNSITVREALLARRSDRPAELSIRRLESAGESPPAPGPLVPADLVRALRTTAAFTEGVVRQFIGWTETFAKHPNEIRRLPAELLRAAKGDPDAIYYNGYFSLADGEALVVDLRPPACEYWNIQVTNHWLESLDFLHHDTHVNHRSARYRGDGSVRVVIAKRDPGVPNWIDTVGHDRGCIALRWVKAARDSQPITRVTRLGELGGA